jgi:phasin
VRGVNRHEPSGKRWKLATFAPNDLARINEIVLFSNCRGEHHMNLFQKIFTTRTLVKIIFVLAAIIVMRGLSTHFDFSWVTALAAG